MSLNRYRHRNRVFLSLSKMSEDRVFGYWRYKNDTGQGVKPANSSLTFIGIGEFSQHFCVYSIERRFFNHIIAREKQKYKMVYVKLTRAWLTPRHIFVCAAVYAPTQNTKDCEILANFVCLKFAFRKKNISATFGTKKKIEDSFQRDFSNIMNNSISDVQFLSLKKNQEPYLRVREPPPFSAFS